MQLQLNLLLCLNLLVAMRIIVVLRYCYRDVSTSELGAKAFESNRPHRIQNCYRCYLWPGDLLIESSVRLWNWGSVPIIANVNNSGIVVEPHALPTTLKMLARKGILSGPKETHWIKETVLRLPDLLGHFRGNPKEDMLQGQHARAGLPNGVWHRLLPYLFNSLIRFVSQ